MTHSTISTTELHPTPDIKQKYNHDTFVDLNEYLIMPEHMHI